MIADLKKAIVSSQHMTRQAIEQQAKTLKKKYGPFSDQIAYGVLAQRAGIDISDIFSPQEMAEVRDVIERRNGAGDKNEIVYLPQPQTIPAQQTSKLLSKPTKINLDPKRVKSAKLREIVSRDSTELRYAMTVGLEKMSKTCMILSGSITEALVLDRLTKNTAVKAEAIGIATSAKLSSKPRQPNDPETWDLGSLIEIAQNLSKPLLPADSSDAVNRLRKWRNLVHPGRELKDSATDRIKPTPERARLAISVLEFVARELIN